jgi:mono/diheme cytochrome c family protein
MRSTRQALALGAALALLACSDSASPPAPAPAPAPPPAAAPAAAPAPPPPPAPAVASTPASQAPDAARGKIQFETYCVSCHGPRGEGDGPVAASLDPKPAHLGDRAYMSGKQDDYLFQVIKNGGASVGRSPMMAPWGGSLSDAQIRDVIAYVRSLAH